LSGSAGLESLVDLYQNATTGSTNSTEIADKITAATSSITGLGIYGALVAFLILALVMIAFEFFSSRTSHQVHISNIVLSGASFVVSLAIVGYSLYSYNKLKTEMEVPTFFQVGMVEPKSLAQVLPLAILGSTSIAGLQALTGMYLTVKHQENTKMFVPFLQSIML
jgi:hypothetical protein